MYDQSKWGNDVQIVLRHDTKQALGGDVTVVLAVDARRIVEPVFRRIWEQVFGFERQFSRFLPDSELSQFNRGAGVRQDISEAFATLLTASQAMSQATDGLHNPFILPAVQRAGYLDSAVAGYRADKSDDFRDRAVVSADHLQLETNRQATIPYGTALDLGGCGKGYLADAIADELDRADLVGYWVSLSGDMVTCGFDEQGQPWETGIVSARTPQAESPAYVAGNGERLHIATSGTFLRPGQAKLRGHHLIDPRTGQAAQTDIKLATVIAPSAILADVLASAATIIGNQQAIPYLKSRGALGAVIQTARRDYTYGTHVQTRASRQVAHVS